jgi:hypothetical protein
MPEIPDTVVDKAGWTDLRELDDHGEGLTSWEADFVESITKRLRAVDFREHGGPDGTGCGKLEPMGKVQDAAEAQQS